MKKRRRRGRDIVVSSWKQETSARLSRGIWTSRQVKHLNNISNRWNSSCSSASPSASTREQLCSAARTLFFRSKFAFHVLLLLWHSFFRVQSFSFSNTISRHLENISFLHLTHSITPVHTRVNNSLVHYIKINFKVIAIYDSRNSNSRDKRQETNTCSFVALFHFPNLRTWSISHSNARISYPIVIRKPIFHEQEQYNKLNLATWKCSPSCSSPSNPPIIYLQLTIIYSARQPIPSRGSAKTRCQFEIRGQIEPFACIVSRFIGGWVPPRLGLEQRGDPASIQRKEEWSQ